MAIIDNMHVTMADAKNRLPELVRAVEAGTNVVITRHGKPVAQLTPPPAATRRPQLGLMKGRLRLRKGWNAPTDLDDLLAGEP